MRRRMIFDSSTIIMRSIRSPLAPFAPFDFDMGSRLLFFFGLASGSHFLTAVHRRQQDAESRVLALARGDGDLAVQLADEFGDQAHADAASGVVRDGVAGREPRMEEEAKHLFRFHL